MDSKYAAVFVSETVGLTETRGLSETVGLLVPAAAFFGELVCGHAEAANKTITNTYAQMRLAEFIFIPSLKVQTAI
jgi:hypothetical protein